MTIEIQLPKGIEPIEYLTSFSPAFAKNDEMRGALLGVKDNLRQAEFLPLEPIGMLACLTAEEEAATFLYSALLDKGYKVPNYGKLRRHHDKVKIVLFVRAIHRYFFKRTLAELPSVIRVERDGDRPKTEQRRFFDNFVIIQDDPLATIVVTGQGESGHSAAIENAVSEVLSDVVPNGTSTKHHIARLANRRNLCMYGEPDRKLRFKSVDEIETCKQNCIAMIVVGFLIFNGSSCTPSMNKLVESVFRKISE